MDRADLRVLLDEVLRTRAVQREEQIQGGSSALLLLPAMRREALTALENYADALEDRGYPLPPKMRLELNLLRSMCGPVRHPPSDWR